MDIGEQAFLTVFGYHRQVMKIWVWKRGWGLGFGVRSIFVVGSWGRRRIGLEGGLRVGVVLELRAAESAVIEVFGHHR